MTYAVERGVLYPNWRYRGLRRGRPFVYPFNKMGIGDSFFVPNADRYKRNSVQSAACQYSKRTGVKFTTCTEAGGIRVWRII